MPSVFESKWFNFSFFSSDINEPIHIHVTKGDGFAKIWLEPDASWAFCYDFKSKEKRSILKIINDNKELLIKEWYGYFDKYK